MFQVHKIILYNKIFIDALNAKTYHIDFFNFGYQTKKIRLFKIIFALR